MYSPKISEELVPVLYQAARAHGENMTTLVDRLLYQALAINPLPPEAFSRIHKAVENSRFHIQTPIGAATGAIEELETLCRAPNLRPFYRSAEIDAWYSGAVHGLCRIVRQQVPPSSDSANRPEFGQLYRALSEMRTMAQIAAENPVPATRNNAVVMWFPASNKTGS